MYNVLEKKFVEDKHRRNSLISKKTPMFKLDLLETILLDYKMWTKDPSYRDYVVNLGPYEEGLILYSKKVDNFGKFGKSNDTFEKNYENSKNLNHMAASNKKSTILGGLYNKILQKHRKAQKKMKKSKQHKVINHDTVDSNDKFLNPQIIKMRRRCRRAPVYSANFTKNGLILSIKKSNPVKFDLVKQGIVEIKPLENVSLLTSDMTKRSIMDIETINLSRQKQVTSLYTPSSVFEEALCGGLGNSFISHQS